MSRNRINPPIQKRNRQKLKTQKVENSRLSLKVLSARLKKYIFKSTSARISKKIGIAFLIIGLAFIIIPRISILLPSKEIKEVNPIIADVNFSQSSNESAIPIRILIPSVAIDLTIQPSKLVKGFWEVHEKTAGYGIGSATPGTLGNSVVFAHAREGLFLPLKGIAFGKDIYILTKYSWHQYRVDEIREVNPQDVYIIQKTADERLTIFTCSGFLDQKRLVVIAKPVK